MLNLRKTLIPPPPLLLRTVISRYLSTQPATAIEYDQQINAAGRSRDLATVHRLLIDRHRDGFFNTNHTFKFISADPTVLDDLLQTFSSLDRGFARKNAYDSLVARLAKLHYTDEALRVVKEMAARNIGVNCLTFHPILSALTRKKKMEEYWRVMDMMKGEVGVSPDVTAYNFGLTTHCVVGDLRSAAKVMMKMDEIGMKADSRTYDALVLGACRAGKVEGALVVLRRMVDDGLPVLHSTHVHVISAMLKLGYFGQAVEFVLCYGGKDKALDTESFGILASRLIRLKKNDEAKLVLEEMRKRGLEMGEKLKDFYKLH